MDVSHRGGNPGFIEVLDDATLLIPERQNQSCLSHYSTFKMTVLPHDAF
jgi:hypothetical protein